MYANEAKLLLSLLLELPKPPPKKASGPPPFALGSRLWKVAEVLRESGAAEASVVT